MDNSRLAKVALGFSAISILCIFTAFITPSWLVTDGQLEKPKFENLGLWIVCFKNNEDVRYWHDTPVIGCHWVYQQEYYIAHEFLLPNFYVAVQFFFSICFFLVLIGGIITLSYITSRKNSDTFVCLSSLLGSDMLVAGVCGTIACIIFGIYGDSKSWMPHWEHNDVGYSFWAACIGTVTSYIAGLCFLIVSRKRTIKRNFLYE